MTLDRPTVFLAGTAGAGKSSLTAALREWFGEQSLDSLIVNLDPGADRLPYEPEVDIRDWVRLDELMAEMGLGPNGAQVAAADLIAVNLGEVIEACAAAKPDVYLVDTPGQLELFAFRASGPYVVSALTSMPYLAFLMDPIVSKEPRGLVAQLLLAATVHFRLQVPTVNVISKCDLLPQTIQDQVLQWVQDHDTLMDAVENEPITLASQLNVSIARTLADFAGIARTVATSARTSEGLGDIYNAVLETYAGGEKEIPR